MGIPWWSSAGGLGLIPGQGTKIPQAAQQKNPKKQNDEAVLNLFLFLFLNLFIIYLLFIFGCVGSSFLCEDFLQLWQVGATLHRGAWASHYHGLSCCGAWAPDAQAQ